MWYFTWILGLSVAVLFAVVNAVWLEVQDDNDWHDEHLQNDALEALNNVKLSD
ncbi:cytochrome bd-I oxidase subunit CydX [Granulosicoccus antarcticus]|uniref:Cytochrome bd ubiquinol oxidase subunit X n=1 Tax=Granulosicoccus antarcticus IMCC3135 TaxID=1192854 RepID=A0A2Z2NZ73_9GAMM|nr:Cytochrome bd ubiquinol oxidase subunit X [Granulosicoccus antarcticus IMCC3135]